MLRLGLADAYTEGRVGVSKEPLLAARCAQIDTLPLGRGDRPKAQLSSNGTITPAERRFIEVIGELHGTKVDVDSLPSVAPGEVAEVINEPHRRKRVVPLATIAAMVEGDVTSAEAAAVRALARVGAAEPEPGFLNGILRLGQGAKHPVSHPAEMAPVLLEPPGPPVALVHGHIPSPRFVVIVTYGTRRV
jgi:hypothetical protein